MDVFLDGSGRFPVLAWLRVYLRQDRAGPIEWERADGYFTG